MPWKETTAVIQQAASSTAFSMSLSRVRTTKENRSNFLGQLRKILGQLKHFLGQLRNDEFHNLLIVNNYLLFLLTPHFNHI